jgi:nucleoside-diphosphate-sugar epimerase
MSGALKLMVTGAAGFIGSHVVSAARQRGHTVVAVVRARSKCPLAWEMAPGIQPVIVDLSDPAAEQRLASALQSVDVVIHTAAHLVASDTEHKEASLKPLQVVLNAIGTVSPASPGLVHLSSLSVYGLSDQPACTIIDENTPLETAPQGRDPYCRTKLEQDRVAIEVTSRLGIPLKLARPGFVYDQQHLWNAHLGVCVSGFVIQLAKGGEVPIIHVDQCAALLVRCAELAAVERQAPSAPEAFNLLDSDLPTRERYIAALRSAGSCRGAIDASWLPLGSAAKLSDWLGLGHRMPGLLHPATFAFRLRPFRFTNKKARSRLKWKQTAKFEELLKLSPQPHEKQNP